MSAIADSAVVVSRVRRVTVAGLALNIALTVAKGTIGALASSQALVADAIHSLSDLVTDLAVLLGVKYWAAPADEDHPYGHGKIESLVTLFIALALVLVAWHLGSDAVRSLLAPERAAAPGLVAFWVALASIVSKEALFRWTRRVARTVSSPALEANAWHHRSDALSSIPVAVAVAVAAIWPSLAWVDAVGALVVGVFILHVAWEIGRPALEELIDANNHAKAEAVAEVARHVPGVLAVHQSRTRRCGATFLADLHVQVASDLTVGAAHTLGHDVSRAIVAAGLEVSEAVVHVEPRDVRAIVSLGSNVEPRLEMIERALRALGELPCTHLVKTSSIIETEPVDVPEEFRDRKFLNCIAVLETALEPLDFSRRMHAIEDSLGRVRTVRNGPRTIDIDLIDFDGLRLETPELTLPHPRARARAFVMDPLKELGAVLTQSAEERK